MAAKSGGKGDFVKSRSNSADILRLKNFIEITLLAWLRSKEIEVNSCFFYFTQLRRYKQICVFAFLAKIQNDCHFWGDEIFWKIAKSSLPRYLVGRIYRHACLSMCLELGNK